jgi:hypothetical protein
MSATGMIDRIFEARWAEELARNLALTKKVPPEEALRVLMTANQKHKGHVHTMEELSRIVKEAYEIAPHVS